MLKPRLAPVALTAGQVLSEPGERVERAYFPVSGLISARGALEDGRQMECVLIGRTNALGAVAASAYEVSLTRDICIISGHAWTVRLPELRAATRMVPGLGQQLERYAFAQMAYAVKAGLCNAMHPVEQRIARWLLAASELLGSQEIPIAQEELSNCLGVQRSAVNPALRRLQAEGLLDLARGRIRLANVAALTRRACECDGPIRRILELEPEAVPAQRNASSGR
jgi:CRP-like cAMP-binding protein